MKSSLTFTHNRACTDQIYGHFKSCDDIFVPKLSERVNLLEYAGKLHRHADRFEAWSQSTLVGLVAIYANDEEKRFAHISNVSVDPSWQRQAIAQTLLAEAIQYARRQAFPRAKLVVDKRNKGAMKLYEKLGFSCQHIAGAALSMEKVLP